MEYLLKNYAILERNLFYLTTGSKILASAGPTGEEAAGIREADAGGGLRHRHRPSAAEQAPGGRRAVAGGGGSRRVLEKDLKERGHVLRFIAPVKIRHFSITQEIKIQTSPFTILPPTLSVSLSTVD